jgi:hypothetical protein
MPDKPEDSAGWLARIEEELAAGTAEVVARAPDVKIGGASDTRDPPPKVTLADGKVIRVTWPNKNLWHDLIGLVSERDSATWGQEAVSGVGAPPSELLDIDRRAVLAVIRRCAGWPDAFPTLFSDTHTKFVHMMMIGLKGLWYESSPMVDRCLVFIEGSLARLDTRRNLDDERNQFAYNQRLAKPKVEWSDIVIAIKGTPGWQPLSETGLRTAVDVWAKRTGHDLDAIKGNQGPKKRGEA